jgi:NADH-quinone oxidoreductase subunit N
MIGDILFLITILTVIVLEAFHQKSIRCVLLIGTACAFIGAITYDTTLTHAWTGWSNDGYATVLSCFWFGLFGVLVLITQLSSEQLILAGLSTLGGLLLAHGNHFLGLLMGLELLSMPLCVWLVRSHNMGIEAGIKWFLLGAMGLGVMAYGIAHWYGLFGDTSMMVSHTLLAELITTHAHWLQLAFGLILFGVALKLGVAPCHLWVPAVYEACSFEELLWLSTLSKLGALSIMIRLMLYHTPLFTLLKPGILAIGVLSVTWGHLAAWRQTSVKRLLAYASVGQMGLAWVLLLSGHPSWMMGYVVQYIMVSLLMIWLLYRYHVSDDLPNAMLKQHRWCWNIACFSMMGIPLTPGFLAKCMALWSVITMPWFALLLLLLSMLSAGYYLPLLARWNAHHK